MNNKFFNLKNKIDNEIQSRIPEEVYHLNSLQMQSRWLFYNYLNYDYFNQCDSLKSFFLKKSVKNINKNVSLLAIKNPDFNKLIINSKLKELENSIINYLYLFYSYLENRIKSDLKRLTIKQPIEKIPRIKYKEYDHFYSDTIYRIKDNLFSEKIVQRFYISGSIATKDYIKGWSDLDGLLILESKYLNQPKNIIKLKEAVHGLRFELQKIDKFQLHGLFILTDIDLKYYSQSFYPFILFQNSKLLFGDNNLNFFIRNDEKERWDNFWYEGVEFFINTKTYETDLEKKLLMHRIASLPFLFLQTIGLHIYKKDSFEIIKAFFDKSYLKIFNYNRELMYKFTDKILLSINDSLKMHNNAKKLVVKMLDYIIQKYGV